jgi:hypothetical protein
MAERASAGVWSTDVFAEGYDFKKQRAAANWNIKKAAKAARQKRTIAHLSKRTRTALGKEGAQAARKPTKPRKIKVGSGAHRC